MIPKIIHQTWKSRELPERTKKWSQTFQRLLPQWEYRFWDDQACLEFLRRYFPDYLEVYASLRNSAQRADLFRYMALFTFGGLYADIDCECKRSLDFISDADEFVVCPELQTTSRRVMGWYQTDLGEFYCQWTFLSRPQHPILASVVEEIRRNVHKEISDNPFLDGVKRTGPHVFTKAVKDYLNQGGVITIVPSSFFGCCEGRNAFRFALSFIFPGLFRRVYVRHHFEGSWIDKQVKREMLLRNLFFLNPAGKHKQSS